MSLVVLQEWATLGRFTWKADQRQPLLTSKERDSKLQATHYKTENVKHSPALAEFR